MVGLTLPSLFRLRKPRLPRRDPKVPQSILDIPFEAYDPATHLPRSIPIGEKVVTPFVSVEQGTCPVSSVVEGSLS
jgi:hypothetical protein